MFKLALNYQVKPLKAANVTYFFGQFGNTGVVGVRIVPYIAFVSSLLPRLVENGTIRRILLTAPFDISHTTYASTAVLGVRMLHALE